MMHTQEWREFISNEMTYSLCCVWTNNMAKSHRYVVKDPFSINKLKSYTYIIILDLRKIQSPIDRTE
jgi:hypothetical protein